MQAVCDVLEDLLNSGVIASYAIGGATAAGFHGEPFATRDIDVFVFLKSEPGSMLISLDPVFRKLGTMGFDQFDEEGILIHGFPVQFLAAAPGLESEAVEEARLFEWDGHRARVVYLVSLPSFDRIRFTGILQRHGLSARWHSWAEALGLT